MRLSDLQSREYGEGQMPKDIETASTKEFGFSLLCLLISDISETAYCAGWMSGIEYSLWDRMYGDAAASYGQWDITPHEIACLKRLSADIDGWAYYDADEGRTYVSMAEWQVMYAQWKSLK